MNKDKILTTKQKIGIGVMFFSMVVMLTFGTYSFFIAIGNNTQNQELTVQAGNMTLTFSDGNNGFSKELEFGGSAEKTFRVENTGSIKATFSILWMNMINTYLEGSLTYTLEESDSEDGTYTPLVTNNNVPVTDVKIDKPLYGGIEVDANTTKYYKLTIVLNYLESTDQTSDLNARLSTQFKIVEGAIENQPMAKDVLAIKIANAKSSENLNFALPATTDETADGFYSLEDDYGTSYFYRGDVTDNYVKFGTWANDTPDVYHGQYSADNSMVKEYATLSECQSVSNYNYNCTKISRAGKPMYWRIIRVNGDGSVRLLYDGTEPHQNEDESSDRIAWASQVFNAQYEDAKYVGYMFGGSQGSASSKRVDLGAAGYTDATNAINNQTNSDIKTKLEEWYVKNLSSQDEYIEDSIFCNDRSIPGKSLSGYSSDTGLGYAKNKTAYGGYMRSAVESSNAGKYKPQFTCSNKNDAFTKNESEKGNGKLAQKVGLITMDEAWAGGTGDFQHRTENKSTYLYKKNWYWSGSPIYYNSYAHVFGVDSSYFSSINVASTTGAAAPVINLSAEYFNTLMGDGTIGNVFRDPNSDNEG